MTYYLAFIVLDEINKKSIRGFDVMNCPIDWSYNISESKSCGLYAWTTDKKIMKEFKRQRKEEFFIYKKIDSEELIKNQESDPFNSKLKLKENLYITSANTDEMIISTEFENTSACDEGLIFEVFFDSNPLIDPLWIKNKLLSSFEKFGYTYTFFNYSISGAPPLEEDTTENTSEYDMDLSCRQDVFWNNYSYMDQRDNTYRNEKNMKSCAIRINEFNAFIELFGELFKI